MVDLDEDVVKDLKAIASETSVTVRGTNFAVAREVVPFEKLMEMSVMLAKSTVVPLQYQNRPENIFIALDLASRMGLSPMAVMANLYLIQGKASFSGQFISALLKSSSQFKELNLEYVGTPNTDSWGARVTAIKTSTGKPVIGATVTIAIAKKEGWYTKAGSKWVTTPELMLAYRANAWFGRVYAPELLVGLQTIEEIEDSVMEVREVINPFEGA